MSGSSGTGTGSTGTSGSSSGGASVGTSGTSGSSSSASRGSSSSAGSSSSGTGTGSPGTSGSSSGKSAGTSGTSGSGSSSSGSGASSSSGGSCAVKFGFGEDCPCGNDDLTAGCANSNGYGASLDVSGSSSVSTDDLVLNVTDAVAGNQAFLCYGVAPAHTPFFDGILCVAPPCYRLGTGGVSPSGAVDFGPGLVAESSLGGNATPWAISAGETWYFQVVYRDLGESCGSLVNTTNGIEITFAP